MKVTSLRVVGTGLALGLAATLSACGSSTTSSASSKPASSPTTAMAGGSSGSASTMADFGSGCSAVPASGAGSFSGMTSAPVATAASNNPVLSTLVSAVKKANLVDTLNNAKALTVFAPANSAFAKLPASQLNAVMANQSQLTSLLEYHVVAGRLSPSQLDGTHKTLEGGSLSVSGSGTSYTVNGSASVICGNVQTANATVYIINSVLTPPSSGSSSTTMPGGSSASTSSMDFGPGCSSVPSSGAGSFSGMTSAPVATAASNNPLLSTLVTAVKKANLVDTLNNAKGITVFAPDNAAFSKVPSSQLDALLANTSQLTKVLEYHVVAGRLSPSQLAGTHTTLEGGSLSVSGSGTSYTVNGSASVICGNVQTANATVYIINSVLQPPTS